MLLVWFVHSSKEDAALCWSFQKGEVKSSRSQSGNNQYRSTLLYAISVILRIYMWSLVMSFILETLEELAILKNSDVRVKNSNSIVMGWLTPYSLIYLFCKFEFCILSFSYLTYITHALLSHQRAWSREWDFGCKFSHNHDYFTKKKSLVDRLRGCTQVCGIFIHSLWPPCVI